MGRKVVLTPREEELAQVVDRLADRKTTNWRLLHMLTYREDQEEGTDTVLSDDVFAIDGILDDTLVMLGVSKTTVFDITRRLEVSDEVDDNNYLIPNRPSWDPLKEKRHSGLAFSQ